MQNYNFYKESIPATKWSQTLEEQLLMVRLTLSLLTHFLTSHIRSVFQGSRWLIQRSSQNGGTKLSMPPPPLKTGPQPSWASQPWSDKQQSMMIANGFPDFTERTFLKMSASKAAPLPLILITTQDPSSWADDNNKIHSYTIFQFWLTTHPVTTWIVGGQMIIVVFPFFQNALCMLEKLPFSSSWGTSSAPGS